ncbi:hypothetical protein [Phenylobacterium sp.]|uniref:hypothetical protein n=1 Tax=Phenylobacterium sp. TaxID=1871053 RepID=UPI0035265276
MSRGPARSRSSGGLSPMRRLVITAGAAGATLAVLALLLLGWAAWSYNGPGPKAKAGDETTVILRRGAGLSEIGAALERAGVVRASAIFLASAQ